MPRQLFIIFVVMLAWPWQGCAGQKKDDVCKDAAKIGDHWFARQEVMRFGNAIPMDTLYDLEDNLFFTLVDKELDDPNNIYIWKNRTKAAKLVKGKISGAAQGSAVDPATGQVYFASDKGVYRFKMAKGRKPKAKSYALKREDIYNIFIDKNSTMYVIEYGTFEVFTINENKEKVKYGDFKNVTSFAKDAYGNTYYESGGFLYLLRANFTEAEKLQEILEDGFTQISFTQDYAFTYIGHKKGLLYSTGNDLKFKIVEKIKPDVTSVSVDSIGNIMLGYRKKFVKYIKLAVHIDCSIST